MDTKAAIFALMAAWGVGACVSTPAMAQDADPAEDMAEDGGEGENPLLNKVWVRSESDAALPGPMQIFLADGTMVTDSCWETYRLSKWQQVSTSAISWVEDGTTINAEIAELTQSELVLSLKLGNDVQELRFVSATVPYLCPDVVK